MNRTINILCFTLILCGCQTPRVPVIDLSETGWKERTGQALWERPGAAMMAVDLHFAQRADVAWLQLSKGGLPLATVTLTKNAWAIDGSMFGRKAAGRGEPPTRASPAQLARLLGGEAAGRGWKQTPTADGMALQNGRTGERWEVYLDP